MVVATAAAALSSIQTVYQLAAAAQSLKTSTEVRLAISGMLDELNKAKIAAGSAIDNEFALKQRIRELEETVRSLEQRNSQLESYERKRFFPGSFAYVPKQELGAGAEPHYACANCYEGGQKIISLHPTAKLGGRRHRIHQCPSCKSEYELGAEMKPDELPPPPPPSPQVIRYPPSPDAWRKK